MEDRNAAGSLLDFFASPSGFDRVPLSESPMFAGTTLSLPSLNLATPPGASKHYEESPVHFSSTPRLIASPESTPSTPAPVEEPIFRIPYWYAPKIVPPEAVPESPSELGPELKRLPNVMEPPATPKDSGFPSGNGSMMLMMPPGYQWTDIVTSAKVKSVTFGGEFNIPIEADPGNKFDATTGEYTTTPYPDPPHWLDINLNGIIDEEGERALPVAYPRDHDVEISATFALDHSKMPYVPPGYKLMVKAVNTLSAYMPYYFSIPPTEVTVGNGVLTLPPTKIENPFPTYINYGNIDLAWSFSNNSGQSWSDAGWSKNQLYVTLNPQDIKLPVFHTVMHIGTAAAAGETEEDKTIAKIWGAFKSRDVSTVTPGDVLKAKNFPVGIPFNFLHYYKNWDTKNQTVPELFIQKDGQCGAWVKLFIDTVAAHIPRITNATAPNNMVTILGNHVPYNNVVTVERLAVNKWDFVGITYSPPKVYNYRNVTPGKVDGNIANLEHIYYNKVTNQWEYKWFSSGNQTFADLTDLSGISGQNVANPPSLFDNHVIAKIDGKFYDVSYGTGPYATIADWEADSIAGFFVVTAYVDPVSSTKYPELQFRKNSDPASEVAEFYNRYRGYQLTP